MTDFFLDIHDTVDLQVLHYRTIEVDMQGFPTMTIDEIDFWDLEPIPHACVRLIEGKVLEEFVLEEEICNMSLPKLSRAEENVHKDEIKLETPKINAIEINKKPREMRLEVAIPTRNILSDSIPKLHAKQTKILGSKLGRRVNQTRLVKRRAHSMYRPPSKPPDRQNNIDIKAKNYPGEETANNRPPPKSPCILNVNREVVGIIKKENLSCVIPKPRPPPKPPPKYL